MNESHLLIIFVKNPEEGKVKTRLAETVGSNEALNIYRKLLAYTHSVTARLDMDKQVWYSRFIPDKDVWNVGGFQKQVQQGEDLGARMSHAFKNAFSSGNSYEKVAIIGSDCAQLKTEYIQETFKKLDTYDMVLGPSEDGGYYMLAMDAYRNEFFENIPWSTDQVLEETLKIAEKLELKVHLLPELNDVDHEEDWKQVKDRL